MASISSLDTAIIVFYFLLVMSVGFYFSRRRTENSTGYFLAGRNVGWFAIGASLFATNISSEHFIGLAGSGAARGLAVGSFEWMASIFIILLGWVFIPIYLKSGVFTMPEFLGKRFNASSRMYLTTISIIAYILTKISVTLLAGGLLLEKVLGWDLYTSALVMVMLTGVYTIVGGLSAVIYTSVIQAIFLIGGALLLTIIGLGEVGGFSGLHEKLGPGYFDMFKPHSDPDFPWTGIIFGAPILGIWYWCTDQYIVQRVLCAKGINHARTGTIFAGFLKILPVFLLVVPGLVAAVLFPGIKGDEAYPMLVASFLLPAGIKGLVIAGLLAALMSSLAGCFNSTSTLFTMDFYRHYHPDANERKLVLVGRLATVVIVFTTILWVPLTKLISSHMYIYLQSVQAYISPPIAAVFILGIFWKKVNGKGAIWTLISGGMLGAIRFILEIMVKKGYSLTPLLDWYTSMNFLHFAILLFLASSTILIGVSYLTEKIDIQRDLTFSTGKLFDGLLEMKYPVWNRLNIGLSVLLLVVIIGLWSYFF